MTLAAASVSFVFCLRFSRAASASDCPWQRLAINNIAPRTVEVNRCISGSLIQFPQTTSARYLGELSARDVVAGQIV
jgi:hypothetical protein